MSIANTHDRHVANQLLAHLPQHSDVSRHQSVMSTEQTAIDLCHLCQYKSLHAMMAKLAFQLLLLSHPATGHHILLQLQKGEIKC